MNKAFFLSAAVLMTLCSCVYTVGNNGKVIKGEGPLETRELDLTGFNKIVVNGQADITFTQTESEWKVSVYTQENVFDYLDYHVDGETLVLEYKDQVNIRATEFEVSISAPALKKVVVNGASDFEAKDGIRNDDDFHFEVNGAGDMDIRGLVCPKLSIVVNGAGDIDLKDIDVQEVSIVINGAGDASVSGKANEASFSVSGVGGIDATGLQAEKVNKNVSGLAKIKL